MGSFLLPAFASRARAGKAAAAVVAAAVVAPKVDLQAIPSLDAIDPQEQDLIFFSVNNKSGLHAEERANRLNRRSVQAQRDAHIHSSGAIR